jgi:hypothetical protein
LAAMAVGMGAGMAKAAKAGPAKGAADKLGDVLSATKKASSDGKNIFE